MLLKQLAARFGDVPDDVKQRIAAARDATLEKWALRVLTAPTLEAVLQQNAPRSHAPTSRRRAAPRKHPLST